MWEFPGGKIEPDETPRDALVREISEELECEVNVGGLITTTAHEYDFAIIELTTFYCELLSGTPVLTEHEAVKWLRPEQLASLDWAPADVPAVELIEKAAMS
jgi:8-oxo-dGTP diphosphatase